MSKARSSRNPVSRARAVVWTTERVAAVCARHAEGTWLKHACALEGGSYDGLRDAAVTDPEIRRQVDEAHAKGAETRRAAMALSEDWKREAWELERWDREVFHLSTKVEQKTELTGKDGTPLLPVAPRTSAEVRAELERLQRIAAETAADVDDIEKGK